MSIFHHRITLPVVQNLIASGVGVGAVFVYTLILGLLSPCTQQVQSEAARGEQVLIEGNAVGAGRIADDLVAIAPKCGCALALQAAAASAKLDKARTEGRLFDEENYRRQCFQSASNALRFGHSDLRLGALVSHCRA